MPNPISELPAELAEYRLLEKLGQGGMGSVYKARHTRLDRIVALKILPRTQQQDEAAVARFDREMKAIGRLIHPNIVQAYDAREIDAVRFLVMEFIEGPDFSKIIDAHRRLAVADACEAVRQAALGLQAAYEHGLVHRDIKPANLVLTRQGQVKILDLGLARFQTDAIPGGDLTCVGQIMGTPDFIAPEQVSDCRNATIRADIYSLGCTLCMFITGRAPFEDPKYPSPFDKMVARTLQPAPPMRELQNDLPEALAAAIDRMLAKNPAERFATPAEVAEALAPFAIGCNLPALWMPPAPGMPAASTAKDVAEGTMTLGPATKKERGRGRGGEGEKKSPSTASRGSGAGRWLIATVVLLCVAAAGWIVFSSMPRWRNHVGDKNVAVRPKPETPPPAAPKPEPPAIKEKPHIEPVPEKKESSKPKKAPTGPTKSWLGSKTTTPEPKKTPPEPKQESPAPVTPKETPPAPKKEPPIEPTPKPNPLVIPLPPPTVPPSPLVPVPSSPPPPSAIAPFDAAGAKKHQEDWAKHLGVLVVDTNSLGMRLALIPPGEFDRGDPSGARASRPHNAGETPAFQTHDAAETATLPARQGRSGSNSVLSALRSALSAAMRPEGKLPPGPANSKPFGAGPPYHVRITRPFRLSVYEVTQAEYQQVMNDNPSNFRDASAGAQPETARRPVESVSWDQANRFCEMLTALQAERKAGRKYRLPTEAEWEYACRAGSETRYGFSDDAADLTNYAWFSPRAQDRTHPVGQKRPNAWGTYDMLGNVYEWCGDWFEPDYYRRSSPIDPTGPSVGIQRVIRGGSWWNNEAHCRCGFRLGASPEGDNMIGFRVLCEIAE